MDTNPPVPWTSVMLRWGNPMTVLFITQRGILFGMPLTILVLQYFWRLFSRDESSEIETSFGAALKPKFFNNFPFAPFLVGLMAGTLILVHLHSLVTLFIVSAFLFFIRPARWRFMGRYTVSVAFAISGNFFVFFLFPFFSPPGGGGGRVLFGRRHT